MHFYFRVEGSEVFNGDDGYVENKIHQATKIPTFEEEIKLGERAKENFAQLLEVPKEQIIRVSRDEYLENAYGGEEVE